MCVWASLFQIFPAEASVCSCLSQSLQDSAILRQHILVAFLQLLVLQSRVYLADVGRQLLWPQTFLHLSQLTLVFLHTSQKCWEKIHRCQYGAGENKMQSSSPDPIQNLPLNRNPRANLITSQLNFMYKNTAREREEK